MKDVPPGPMPHCLLCRRFFKLRLQLLSGVDLTNLASFHLCFFSFVGVLFFPFCVFFILRAPFVVRFDVSQYAIAFARLGQHSLGVICVLVLHQQHIQEQLIETILSMAAPAEVLQQTNAIMSPLAEKVRYFIYDRLDARGQYTALLGTEHFDGFVKYLLVKDRIQGLLYTTLQVRNPLPQLLCRDYALFRHVWLSLGVFFFVHRAAHTHTALLYFNFFLVFTGNACL